MTLRHLRVFLAVYQTQNVTRAAERLHMTQPTVTRAVQELERYYGVRLFERINRRLYITQSGRQLYARVEELLRRQGCRKVFAVVTSANEPSLAFHRSIGYRDAACFRQVGFKFGRWYDVTWLEKSLCPPGEPSEFPISWKEVL